MSLNVPPPRRSAANVARVLRPTPGQGRMIAGVVTDVDAVSVPPSVGVSVAGAPPVRVRVPWQLRDVWAGAEVEFSGGVLRSILSWQ